MTELEDPESFSTKLDAEKTSPFSRSQDASNLSAMVRYLDFADGIEGCVRFRNQVQQIMGEEPITRILEIGCGTGTLMRQLSQGFPDAFITGTDISADLIDVARSRHHDVLNCSFLEAAGQALPWERLAFDAVVIERVLQHCSDPAAILRECPRVLKPGGRLFLCEPDWHGLDIQPMPPELFSEILSGYLSAFMRPKIGSELEHLLNELGFQDVSILRDDWRVDYPASGRILGLNRIVEIAARSGISIDRAAAFEALFHDTRAALRLPMYHAVARTAG